VTYFKFSFLRRKKSNFTAAALMLLLAAFASGCSKTEISPAANARDLGIIELQAGHAKSLDGGEGKEFWFLATPATNDEFQLDVTLNVRSFVGILDKEKSKATHVTAHSGNDCLVMLGTNAFKFTPVLTAP
jgi:hypothetical protein